ncbi:MAG TPA: M28 family metallopeptidase [Thermomicrobiales bacterium]|nr:M28 family metallopeptidase [Thermomicrobiales bacterium]
MEADPVENGDGGGAGNGPRWLFPGDDDGGPGSRAILLGMLAALVLLVAVIWYFASRGDDDGGNDTTPTATSEAIVDTDATITPDDATSPFDFPTDEPDDPPPTPTEAPRRGGDNQRNNDDSTPESDVDLDSIELGPVAKSCPERCLVRVDAASGIDGDLVTARTRPSFQSAEWVWIVATPPGIAYLEQQHEAILVAESPETLDLYMAIVPAEEASADRAAQLGSVIDSVDEFRLMRADRVPANVRPLTDWGYQVVKVAPAPPEQFDTPDEMISLSNVEIGALMDDVSESRIEEDVLTLQAMGSSDGTGIGSRYYTTTGNSIAAEFLYTRLESYGLKVRYQDFLSWEGYLMVNVIAEIPGEDDSAIYGVMAHLDTIAEDINVSPGADDNATGVSGALEIARILSGYHLAHPVHIIFVNVEEVGIVGSEQFAKEASAAGIPYEGVFNLDSIGAQRQYGYMVTNGDSTTVWMSDLMKEINDTYGLGQVINAQTSEAIVADDNRLRDNGIPSLMIARELYGQSPTHHTSGDTIDTLWLPGVMSCTQVTLLSIASLVN